MTIIELQKYIKIEIKNKNELIDELIAELKHLKTRKADGFRVRSINDKINIENAKKECYEKILNAGL